MPNRNKLGQYVTENKKTEIIRTTKKEKWKIIINREIARLNDLALAEGINRGIVDRIGNPTQDYSDSEAESIVTEVAVKEGYHLLDEPYQGIQAVRIIKNDQFTLNMRILAPSSSGIKEGALGFDDQIELHDDKFLF